MSLMDMMSELDSKKEQPKASSLMDMFRSEPQEGTVIKTESSAPAAAAPVAAAPAAKGQKKAGRPTYKYANGRKMRQVTTSLCEDNVRWLVKYATAQGMTSGQIGYAINRLIEEKRGMTEKLERECR